MHLMMFSYKGSLTDCYLVLLTQLDHLSGCGQCIDT